MGETINDLYLKYANKIGATLERDRYFQYLFEMVQAGDNVLQQKYQVMHKVVDEAWISTIEDSLDAINTIIEKPRRFIDTKEEVVPVALARKITADSVRHLSMNTQFIASSEDGDIQPTRVLNVSTEESYNLYENRFIYHLIQRLVTFIDKRTDVIFWSTGDETQNTISFQSKVDDAYEQIDYKIEMTVKNLQSYAENETDNMSVFMRIDRVRRMVMALKNSSFCDIMAGCSKVRSPIQRTNLIMKDPYYRTCYKLWQFLENYDEVGYSIEVQDTALEFDEEYLFQMYTNLITNYTVFKSLTDGDKRNIDEAAPKKRRVVKPKFIKKIKEVIVDDYDIEDVEIRKVIIEEVTQAQLDAEAKLEEETKARKKAEETLEEMDSQMIALQQQISNLMMMNQEAEIRAEEERSAKEAALAEVNTAKEECEAAKAEAEEAKTEAEAVKQEMEATKTEAEETIAATKREAEETIAATKQEADEAIAATKREAEETIAATKQEAEDAIATTKQEADAAVEAARKEAAETVDRTNAEAKAAIEEARKEAEATVATTKQEAEDAIAATKREAEETIAATKQEAEDAITTTRQEADAAVEAARKEAAETVERTNAEAKAAIEEARKEAEAAIASIRQEAEEVVERTNAEAKDLVEKAKQEMKDAREREQKANNDAKLAKEESIKMLEQVKKESAEEIEAVRAQTKEIVDDANKKANQEISGLKKRNQELEAQRADLAKRKELLEQKGEELTAKMERDALEFKQQQSSLEREKHDLMQRIREANSNMDQLEKKLEQAENDTRDALEKARVADERAQARTLSHFIIDKLGNKKHKD